MSTNKRTKKIKPTVSIGITAYNEAANLGKLLSSIVKQNIASANLIEIVVVSDASTDETDDIVRDFKDARIKLVRHKQRRGVAAARNTILLHVRGDILVSLDADIVPVGNHMIEKLIRPLTRDPEIGLASAVLIAAKPKTFIEKVLVRNHELKNECYAMIDNEGMSIYRCYGPARALSRVFYENLKFPNHEPDDAYSYMRCIDLGMKFLCVESSKVLFRCPSSVRDYIKQSVRFLKGRKEVMESFGDAARYGYRIPITVLFRIAIIEALLHPIATIIYGYLFLMARMAALNSDTFTSTWSVSESTKTL